MKRIYSKLAVGLFALIVGVWIGDGFQPLTSFFKKPQSPRAEDTTATPFINEIDGQIRLRFIGFHQAKDLFADFEVVNGTNYPIVYAGYSFYSNNFREDKNNFCDLVVKQDEKRAFSEVTRCNGAMRKTLQTLEPGESATFSVAKWDVKMLLNLPAIQPEITTQIGFEIYIGNGQQKQIIWTDELRFPETLD
jgi:hypothetical protein